MALDHCQGSSRSDQLYFDSEYGDRNEHQSLALCLRSGCFAQIADGIQYKLTKVGAFHTFPNLGLTLVTELTCRLLVA